MVTETIEQRVKRVVANQFSVNNEQITPQASFVEDLGADSLDQVQLIMDLEEEFKDLLVQGEIPESDAESLKTIGDVVKYIEEKASSKS
jgi:acyl carrier protein